MLCRKEFRAEFSSASRRTKKGKKGHDKGLQGQSETKRDFACARRSSRATKCAAPNVAAAVHQQHKRPTKRAPHGLPASALQPASGKRTDHCFVHRKGSHGPEHSAAMSNEQQPAVSSSQQPAAASEKQQPAATRSSSSNSSKVSSKGGSSKGSSEEEEQRQVQQQRQQRQHQQQRQ